MIETTAAREAIQAARLPEGPEAAGFVEYTAAAGGGPSLSFGDLLDVINPLQHIPIISTIYRKFTGDDISPVARVGGATLFGGPIGAAFALVDAAIEHKTGRDLGANVMAALFPDNKIDPATEIAAQAPDASAASVVQSFVPRTRDPIQLVPSTAASPSFAAARAPDLQALAGFETAGGARAFGDPIKLEPRTPVEPASVSETRDEVQAHPKRMRMPPPADLPKGAAAGLARQATRAYVATAGVPAPETGATPAAQLSRVADNGHAVRSVELVTEDGRNDWIVQSMMNALDKYGETSRRQSTSSEPPRAVWR